MASDRFVVVKYDASVALECASPRRWTTTLRERVDSTTTSELLARARALRFLCLKKCHRIRFVVLKLRRVEPVHESLVLQFERDNRAYFARSISDRGDDFFEQFAARHRELMAEQEAGLSAYYLLLDDDEMITGRFNLYEVVDGAANVGYRVGERFSGSGVATFGVIELCRIAQREHSLRTLSASVSDENVASQRVLVKAGFVPIETTVVAGRPGMRYEINLEGN
jgi:ribosomal-protein-alanine N-acetyltransferase